MGTVGFHTGFDDRQVHYLAEAVLLSQKREAIGMVRASRLYAAQDVVCALPAAER